MRPLEADRTVASPRPTDDERSLLIGLELLLEREEEVLATRDAIALATLADERERLTDRLAEVARVRRASPAAEDAELVALYERLRQRHDVRAQVIRRHAERNGRALGVLAQATGQGGLYQADGRVPLQHIAL